MSRLDKTTFQNSVKLNSQNLTKKRKSKNYLFSTVSPNLNFLHSAVVLSTKTNFSFFAQTFFSHLFGFFVGRPTFTVFSNEMHVLKNLFKSNAINSSDKRTFFKSQNLRTYWTHKIGTVAEVVKKDSSRPKQSRTVVHYLSPTWHRWSYLWSSDSFLNLPYFRLIGSITNKSFKPSHYQAYTLPKIYKKWKRRKRKAVFKNTSNFLTRKQFLSSIFKLRLLKKLNQFDSFFKNFSSGGHSLSIKPSTVLVTKKRLLRLKPRTKSFRDRAHKRALKSFFRIPSSSKKRMFDSRHSSFIKLFYTLVSSAKFSSNSLHSSKKPKKKMLTSLFQSFERHTSSHYLSYTQFFSRNVSYSFEKRSYLYPEKKIPTKFNASQFQTLFNLWSNSCNTQSSFYTKEKRLTMLTRKKYPRRRLFISQRKSYTTKILPLVLKLNLERYKHYFTYLLKLQLLTFPLETKNKKKNTIEKKRHPLKLIFSKNKRLLNFKLFTQDNAFLEVFDVLYNLSFRQSYFYTKSFVITKWRTRGLTSGEFQQFPLDSKFYNNSRFIVKKPNKSLTWSIIKGSPYQNVITSRYNKLLTRKSRLLVYGHKLLTRAIRGVRKSNFSIIKKLKGRRKILYLTRFRLITKKSIKYLNYQHVPFVGLIRRTSYKIRSRLPKRRFILKKTTPQMRLRIKKRRNLVNENNFNLVSSKHSRNSFNLKNFKSSFVLNNQYLDQLTQKRVSYVNASSNCRTIKRIFNPLKNSTRNNSHLELNFRLLSPTKLKSFRRGSHFLIQLLSVLKTLPEIHLTARKKFFYSDPFNFVDYKRLKKTVFRRLIMQRTKMLKSPFRFTSRGLSYLDSNPRLLNQFDYKRYPSDRKNSRVRTSIFNYKTHYKLFFGRMKPYYDYRGGDSADIPTFIRKIRFKPGYQRMWRRERNIFKETFKLTHRYQYRLTPKIQLMYYPTRYTFLKSSKFQLKLSYALVLSRLASDQWTSDLLIDNKYVYLNGVLVTNGFTMIFPNDFLQLIISLRFYVLHRWLHMLAFQRFNSWLRRYYKTYRIKKQLFKDFTFRSLPDSVLNLQNSFHDVPKTMEVDYFTLSSFVLYSSKEYNLTHPLPINVFRLYVINMYNWKYLT